MVQKAGLKNVYKATTMALIAALLFVLFIPCSNAAERYEILMLGDTDEYVLVLQKKLHKLSFFKSTPTGYYGSITQQAVIDYQIAAGLRADGKAGPLTLETLMGEDFVLHNRAVWGEQDQNALYPGDKGSVVADLQQRLLELEYYAYPKITGYYGTVTEKAVERFQRTNNLTIDGIADTQMLAALYSENAKYACVYPGDRGSDVKSLQKRLKQLGYMESEPSGYFGTLTQQALMEFQALSGLSVDAKAGKETRTRLFSPNAPCFDGVVRTDQENTQLENLRSVDKMLALAQEQLNKKYVYQTAGPATFDSSGFVYFLLKNTGVSTTRYCDAGFSRMESSTKISTMDTLQPGDLLFFTLGDSGRINHSGFYLGNKRFIHASMSDGCVTVSSLDSHYHDCFCFARRVF